MTTGYKKVKGSIDDPIYKVLNIRPIDTGYGAVQRSVLKMNVNSPQMKRIKYPRSYDDKPRQYRKPRVGYKNLRRKGTVGTRRRRR